MMLSYLVAFCRAAIVVVFLLSLLRKAPNISALRQAIINFRLLPQRLALPAAWMVLGAELAVVALLIVGGPWLWLGFGLAAMLLLGFSIALASVVIRRIPASCNCFGASEKLISPTDLWRNAGFLLCALGGCGALAAAQDGPASLGLAEWSLVALGAAVFVTVWLQLGEIVQLFQGGA